MEDDRNNLWRRPTVCPPGPKGTVT